MRNLWIWMIGVPLLVSVVGCAKGPASGTKVGATMTQHILLAPADVTWGDGPATLPPGAKLAVVEGDPKAPDALFTIRIKVPDGYAIPPHFHPADEHITVIVGTFNMGMGDTLDRDATTPLLAGSFAVMPKGHHHFAWASGETVVQIHGVGPWGITYVNSADDPRNAESATLLRRCADSPRRSC